MKTLKDCPYITPCGFCKRKQKQCEEFEKERIRQEKLKNESADYDKVPWEQGCFYEEQRMDKAPQKITRVLDLG